LCSSLERIVTASGPGFGDWQWRLAILPFAFGGLGVYCAGNVLSYAFVALTFCEIVAPKLMKKLADIYFMSVTQMVESTFSLSTRQMALWKSQMEDHTFDWPRVVSISGLGQTMNGRTNRCVLCYRLGVPLFSVSKPCSACSKVFMGDIYRDHAVSCAGIVGIKHQHNVVCDTLVDICYQSGISSGKEVNIGLGGARDKSLRPADVLLYSWDIGRDVCVDLTGSSPLTQIGMVDFVSGRAVTEVAQRKCVKYEAKCADIGYGFLPFSFSSFWELEKDAVTLLKRIWKNRILTKNLNHVSHDHVNPITRRTINHSASGKLRDKNAEESCALLEDLALYDNKCWNDPRDFAKPVKEISLPQDVQSISNHRLIELENQVQRLMKAHLSPKQPVQVSKISSLCKICSGPHNTQYCMENPDPSKLLSPKYLSQSSLAEQNRNPSSLKRVHFINSIVILNKEDEAKKEERVKPSTAEYKDHEMTVRAKEEFEEKSKEELEEGAKNETEEEEEDSLGYFDTFPTMKEIRLYLMRRSLEVLRMFHWMILGGLFNQLSHVSSPLLSKP
ncbi:hypothetical protein Tco_1334572, partial [Tanacetum coccineum]